MKIRARITMEAEITESEAVVLIQVANQDQFGKEVFKKLASDILRKKFPNVGSDSYIPGNWLEEEIAKPLGLTNSRCEDLEIPEGEKTR